MNEPDTFLSHAQNGEDVVLWRALGHIEHGVYIDVGANDPSDDSVTRSFYDRGWTGIAVEPNSAFAAKFRAERPRDQVVEAVVTDSPDASITLHVIDGTGLSTIVDSIGATHSQTGFAITDVVVETRRLDDVIEASGLGDGDIHFLLIDTEGAERAVLGSIDFTRFRPWVLVVEATAPRSTERTHGDWEPALLAAGYIFCLFDGLSRFYVAAEHSAQLRPLLDYPACVFDRYTTVAGVRAEEETERLHNAVRDEALRADTVTAELRDEALRADTATAELRDEAAELARVAAELVRTRQTLSWRLTRPLRSVQRNLHPGADKR